MSQTNNNDIERRSCELRASVSDDGKISGYAAVFNSLSEDLGGFKELITADAMQGVIEQSDVFAVLDHDMARGVLARSKQGIGTLKLAIDGKGLRYEFTPPDTPLGKEVTESIRRGDITGSSFAFSVESDEWSKDYTLRTIRKIRRLYDVSPVYQPAYEGTSVALRSLATAKDEAKKALDEYYKDKRSKLK